MGKITDRPKPGFVCMQAFGDNNNYLNGFVVDKRDKNKIYNCLQQLKNYHRTSVVYEYDGDNPIPSRRSEIYRRPYPRK